MCVDVVQREDAEWAAAANAFAQAKQAADLADDEVAKARDTRRSKVQGCP